MYLLAYSLGEYMKKIVFLSFLLCFSGFVTSAEPQAVKSVRQFTFNHSLWEHSAEKNATVGYWLGEFAKASKTKYAWNGQFGQMDYTALPPSAQLGSLNSKDIWVPESASFGKLKIDNIVIMPPNFVQYESGAKEIKEAQRVIDYVAKEQPGVINYIYEHWPEAVADQLSDGQWAEFKQQTNGKYHKWFINYQDQLIKSRPDIDIRMIPVGPIITDILNNKSLQASNYKWVDLYEDNSPHGTDDLYFLASIATYQAMYGQKVSGSYKVPSSISDLIGKDFVALNEFVWQRLSHYNGDGVRVWP